MKVTIIIHKEKDSAYGVTVPDFPGCFSCGSTLEEAYSNAVEAIECHVEGLIKDWDDIPDIKPADHYLQEASQSSGILGLVDVGPIEHPEKFAKEWGINSKKLEIEVPEKLLQIVDSLSKKSGEPRDYILSQAIFDFLKKLSDRPNTK